MIEALSSTAACALGLVWGQPLPKRLQCFDHQTTDRHCAETVPQVLGHFRDRVEGNDITLCKSMMDELAFSVFFFCLSMERYSATVIFPRWKRMVSPPSHFSEPIIDLDHSVN
jgi:hypothetical protein